VVQDCLHLQNNEFHHCYMILYYYYYYYYCYYCYYYNYIQLFIIYVPSQQLQDQSQI
jgi:hypothetical protein